MSTHKRYKMTSTFDFGKHKGEKVCDVIDTDPGYILWCIANIDWFDCTKAVKANAEEADEPNHGPCYPYDADFEVEDWVDPLNF